MVILLTTLDFYPSSCPSSCKEEFIKESNTQFCHNSSIQIHRFLIGGFALNIFFNFHIFFRYFKNISFFQVFHFGANFQVHPDTPSSQSYRTKIDIETFNPFLCFIEFFDNQKIEDETILRKNLISPLTMRTINT